jgi:hypothetical protein
MDFFGSRAISSLIAVAAASGLMQARADCSALQGTYAYRSTAAAEADKGYLGDLVLGAERRKLVRLENPLPAQRVESLSSGPVRSRPKVTHLASTVAVSHGASGLRMEFRDAQGKTLVEAGPGDGWACNGSRLVRSNERLSGLGDQVRTERIDESLSRSPAGSLVHSITTTVVDPPGGKPRRQDFEYKSARG